MDVLKHLDKELIGLNGTPLDPERLETLEVMLHGHYGDALSIISVDRFKSKKNVVLRLDTTHTGEPLSLVAKLFVTGNYSNELACLKLSMLKGPLVPPVLMAEDGVILMEMVPGETLVEEINWTFDTTLIDALAVWYHCFHEVQGVIKGDPRLRNFIVSDNGLVGLDFEEARGGHWIQDIGGISASLLDTNPIFDRRKRVLVWRLLEEYLERNAEVRDAEIDSLFVESVVDALEKTAYYRRDDKISELVEYIQREGIPV